MADESNFSPYGHPKGHMDPTTGQWVRNADVPIDEGSADDGEAQTASLHLAIDATMTDGTVLYTVPQGQSLLIEDAFWDVTTPFSGGSSSAIGVSSNTAPASAKGAILGGASGDTAATLGSTGKKQGTAGSAMATDVLLPAGATIRLDRITSAFTAGAGFVDIVGRFVS